MVRKHGWQLPAHTFQVVAITVFCLLVVAFYTFFAPFLGGRIWEYALIGAYSPVALLVFVLYVRCTAINPADPGIMSKFDSDILSNTSPKHGVSSKGLSGRFDEPGTGAQSSPSSVLRSPVSASNSGKRNQLEAEQTDGQVISSRRTSRKSSCCKIGGILCVLFVHPDCRREDSGSQQEGAAEDALFCTLCDAEVRKFSKHCRSCDKCVDGFDHHCGWLNNCIGRKNYITFISFMATSLVWLAIEAAVGIAVFVRCFVNKRKIEAEIVDRLGNGFSRAPFATVVAVCTVLSLLACVPLGELFFFHMILIRKGLTTYEYVVAMRAMSDAGAGESVDEDPGIILYSPSGSATTGRSGGSSLGLQYKGAWCTPPRVFVDYQEEVAPQLEPGMVPSTVDPDAIGFREKGNKAPKRAVKISAWKLARLDSSEAMKAAAKARDSSSILRPIDNHHSVDPDLSTSENTSVRSSMSADTIGNKETRNELRISPLRNSCAPSQGSRDEYETGTQSMSSFSSPSHVHGPVALTAIPPAQGLPRPDATTSVLRLLSEQQAGAPGAASSNRNCTLSYASSEFDEKILHKNSATDPLLLSAAAPATSLLRDIKRTSVVWDQEAGRYVSVPLSAAEARNRPALRGGTSNLNAGSSSNDKRPTPLPREPSKPTAKHPVQQSEKLTYTGESIFFGGPLLHGPGSRNGQERLLTNMARESRFKRDAASHQLPVFLPGDLEPNVSSRSGLR